MRQSVACRGIVSLLATIFNPATITVSPRRDGLSLGRHYKQDGARFAYDFAYDFAYVEEQSTRWTSGNFRYFFSGGTT